MARSTLRTPRLLLRPVTERDDLAVIAALNDISVSGWLAIVPYPYGPADFQCFQAEYAVPGHTFAVEDAGGFAGIIGIENRTLGYWFAPRCHGLGFATEAARAVLTEHFADDPSEVLSGYFQRNDRSANVLRKLRFVETGRDVKYCRALDLKRPHVCQTLSQTAFRAACPNQAPAR